MSSDLPPPQPASRKPSEPLPSERAAFREAQEHADEALVPVSPRKASAREDLKVYSHSSLVFWWPVWIVGYWMAFLSYSSGKEVVIGESKDLIYPGTNLGVLFFLTLMIVILITNVSVRGLASGLVILALAFVGLLLAYLGLWEGVLSFFGNLRIYLNCGAYFWFSTLLFVMWLISVFIIDRLTCWHFTAGQLTHEYAFNTGSRSYDTNGMVLEKHREDIFRHWLLGIGSGDLEIRTSGGTSETIAVQNVLFIGSKIRKIRRLIAESPDTT